MKDSNEADDLVYSPVAIDYSKGVVKMPDGTLRGNKIGCYVKSMKWVKDSFKKNKEDILNLSLAYVGCFFITYAMMFWGFR